MQYSAEDHAGRVAITSQLAADIEDYSISLSPARYSWRIKPSNLGDECTAKLWHAYRWTRKKQVPGFVARIFEDGQAAEKDMVRFLRATGWTVEDRDPNAKSDKFPQFKVSDFDGHLSGYLDGKCSHPEYTAGIKWLLEEKSYNTSRFSKLKNKKSLVLADNDYYIQVCIYMLYYNLPYCLFFAKNKNDSDFYYEIIPRDDKTAKQFLHKAQDVINSQVMPKKVSQDATFHLCKFCDYVGPCQNGEAVDVNCRSCKNAYPIPGGKFRCSRFNDQTIPNDALEAGCGYHEPII